MGQGALQWRFCSPGSTELRWLLHRKFVHPARWLDGGKGRTHWQPWQAALPAVLITAATLCRATATGMRRIDLTCLIAAPIAIGFLMTYGGSRAAVAVRCCVVFSVSQLAGVADSAFECSLTFMCCLDTISAYHVNRSSVFGTSWCGHLKSCCSDKASARRHISGVHALYAWMCELAWQIDWLTMQANCTRLSDAT